MKKVERLPKQRSAFVSFTNRIVIITCSEMVVDEPATTKDREAV